MSDTNFNRLSYKVETTYGVAASGDYQYIPYLSFGLQGVPETVQLQDIASYREVTELLRKGFNVDGDMSFELGVVDNSVNIYDELMEAALEGTWTSDILQVGTTHRSFTFEREFSDWTGNTRYIVYTGVRIGGFNLNVAYGSLISGSFSLMGAAIDADNTSTVGGNRIEIPAHSILSSAQVTFGDSTADGDLYGACVSSFTMQLDNGLRKKECIDSLVTSGISVGTCIITGSISMYFEDNMAIYNKLINGTATNLKIVFNNTTGTACYTILMSNVEYSGVGPDDLGRDNFNMLTLNYQALYHADNSSLQITRASTVSPIFTLEFRTTTPSESITLPFTNYGTYNAVVDWGDSSQSTITAYNDADRVHTYAAAGTYEVSITGTIGGWSFETVSDSKSNLYDVKNWGSVGVVSFSGGFYDCNNLTVSATDDAGMGGTVTNMSNMFSYCPLANPDTSSWTVDNVEIFDNMFETADIANPDVSAWNMSNATSIYGIFSDAVSAQPDVSQWDVSNVVEFGSAFASVAYSGLDLSNWNTQSATSISSMFAYGGCNPDISGFNVSAVTSFGSLFYMNSTINPNLRTWDMSQAGSMSLMFYQATGVTQANVDNFLAALYEHRASFTWASPTVDLSYCASPSGVYQNNATPTTGKEYIYKLENDPSTEGFKKWVINADPVRITTVGTAQSKTGTSLTSSGTCSPAVDDYILAIVAANSDVVGTISHANVTLGSTSQSITATNSGNVVVSINIAKVSSVSSSDAATITISDLTEEAHAATFYLISNLVTTSPYDKGSTNTGTSSSPTSNATSTLTQRKSLVVGAIGLEGPSTDTEGGWRTGTQYVSGNEQRTGTTGDAADTNITITTAVESVYATSTQRADKTGITSRDYAALVGVFKGIQ